MSFTRETDLRDTLEHLNLGLDGSYSVTFSRREVPVGGCIPDLVYVRFTDAPNRSLWPTRWTFLHCYIVWLLRKKQSLRLETLAALTYEAEAQVEPPLRDLLRSGAIEQTERGSLKLTREMADLEAEVIAVEAKLKRWRDALRQATTYRRFADRVFVAMASGGLPSQEESVPLFRRAGVGLCAASRHELTWILEPPASRNRIGAEREYLIASAAASSRQSLWSLRNEVNASSQART